MPTSTRITTLSATACFCLAALNNAMGQQSVAPPSREAHVLLSLDSARWTPNAQLIGMEIAVLEGDPNSPGSSYTIWVKVREGTPASVLPPHWHPTDERIVVLRGAMGVGMGEVFDQARGREYPAGSFVMLPAGMRHYAWVRGETIMQVYGVGPFVTCFVIQPEGTGRRPPGCGR